jgi:hypothetical protein
LKSEKATGRKTGSNSRNELEPVSIPAKVKIFRPFSVQIQQFCAVRRTAQRRYWQLPPVCNSNFSTRNYCLILNGVVTSHTRATNKCRRPCNRRLPGCSRVLGSWSGAYTHATHVKHSSRVRFRLLKADGLRGPSEQQLAHVMLKLRVTLATSVESTLSELTFHLTKSSTSICQYLFFSLEF